MDASARQLKCDRAPSSVTGRPILRRSSTEAGEAQLVGGPDWLRGSDAVAELGYYVSPATRRLTRQRRPLRRGTAPAGRVRRTREAPSWRARARIGRRR